MKKIKLNGKLSFNKETIAKLNKNSMENVKGGGGLSAACDYITGFYGSRDSCGPHVITWGRCDCGNSTGCVTD